MPTNNHLTSKHALIAAGKAIAEYKTASLGAVLHGGEAPVASTNPPAPPPSFPIPLSLWRRINFKWDDIIMYCAI